MGPPLVACRRCGPRWFKVDPPSSRYKIRRYTGVYWFRARVECTLMCIDKKSYFGRVKAGDRVSPGPARGGQVGRDASPVDVLALRRAVLRDGEHDGRAVGEPLDRLHQALAVRLLTDDLCRAVALKRRGEDLCSRHGAPVHEQVGGPPPPCELAVPKRQHRRGLARAVDRRDHGDVRRQEELCRLHARRKVAAEVAPQIDQQLLR
eukprot:3167301-Prymnesium_polylepis.1